MTTHTLDIDIGNSNCKWQLRLQSQVFKSAVVANSALEDSVELKEAINSVVKVNICCVAKDKLVNQLLALLNDGSKIEVCHFKVEKQSFGLQNSYLNVSQMGADRWLASISAYLRYPRQSLCIVDCGSAINIEFISEQGVHVGGYIVPGLRTMHQSLLLKTAKIKFDEEAVIDVLGPGLNTEHNVVHGTLFMVLSMIGVLLEQQRDQGGLLLLTGGDSLLVGGYFADAIATGQCAVDKNLLLDGFSRIEIAKGSKW